MAGDRFRARVCAAGMAVAAGACLFAPPAGALDARGVARGAAAADSAIPTACRRALARGRAGAFCDARGASRGVSLAGVRGRMVRPGGAVTLRAKRTSRRAQLVLIYRVDGRPVYVRFARFGRGGPLTARVTSRVRGGRLVVSLREGARSHSPARTAALTTEPATATAPAPAASSPAPSTATAGPVASTAGARTCGAVQDGGDATFNRMFATCGPGNTGSDGAYSVPLPDGRTAWLFSDTFVGTLNDDGTRASWRFVHNSLAVQSGTSLTTLHGGTAADPDSMFAQPGGGDWYWTGDGTVENGKLRVFLQRYGATGTGLWDFRFKSSAVATLSLPDLRVEAIDPLPGDSRVAWGAAVLERADYTYVYGVEDLGAQKFAHVARAPRGALGGPWEYYDGAGWVGDESRSARVLGDVSNGFSVLPSGDGVVLVSQALGFSRDIEAHSADGPAGPFGPARTVATVGDPGPGRFTYNAVVHPEFSDDSGVLLSWNVNSSDGDETVRDASVYRPRFMRVDLSASAP